MVIKQLLELTGAGPWEQKDGTFYLASLLSMNLCSKEKCWYYETRSAQEVFYGSSITRPMILMFWRLLDPPSPTLIGDEWTRIRCRCRFTHAGESAFHICTSASNQSLVLAGVRKLFLNCGQPLLCRMPKTTGPSYSNFQNASHICVSNAFFSSFANLHVQKAPEERLRDLRHLRVGICPDSQQKTGAAEHLGAFKSFKDHCRSNL